AEPRPLTPRLGTSMRRRLTCDSTACSTEGILGGRLLSCDRSSDRHFIGSQDSSVYSSLSATKGSIEAARLAGNQLASSAAMTSTPTIEPSTCGSPGLTL